MPTPDEEARHTTGVRSALADRKTSPTTRTLAAPARWYRYFNQGTYWVPNGRQPLAIADMDAPYRLNCVRFLERNAARYAALYADGCSAEEFAFGLAHPDAPDEIFNEIYRQAHLAKLDPVAWIKTTKLYRALEAELPKKGAPLRKLGEKARHWGDCEQRTRPKKGRCTCAELAARDRERRAEHERALAEATVPE